MTAKTKKILVWVFGGVIAIVLAYFVGKFAGWWGNEAPPPENLNDEEETNLDDVPDGQPDSDEVQAANEVARIKRSREKYAAAQMSKDWDTIARNGYKTRRLYNTVHTKQPELRPAVRALQYSLGGLMIDGAFGPATMKRLFAVTKDSDYNISLQELIDFFKAQKQ